MFFRKMIPQDFDSLRPIAIKVYKHAKKTFQGLYSNETVESLLTLSCKVDSLSQLFLINPHLEQDSLQTRTFADCKFSELSYKSHSVCFSFISIAFVCKPFLTPYIDVFSIALHIFKTGLQWFTFRAVFKQVQIQTNESSKRNYIHKLDVIIKLTKHSDV